MEVQDLVLSTKLEELLKEFHNALKKIEEYELGFNIFSLISDTYYKENFHSDIIYALLNPNGEHKEGRLFLDLFLEHFIGSSANYENDLHVHKEHPIEGQRRIDLLISSSSHAIIIENKINNAIDMDNQLVDYYKHSKNKGLEVDAILYLTLSGDKDPDVERWNCNNETKSEIKNKLKRIAAFDIPDKKLSIYQWLEKCKEKSIKDNTKFIIAQYQQLLKSLRRFIMQTSALKNYYEWISNQENKGKAEKIENLIKMHNNLFYYYPEKLEAEIENDKYIRSCYQECKPPKKIPNEETTELNFEGIGGDANYRLRVRFKNNMNCEINIYDAKKLNRVDKLKLNEQFGNFFDEDSYIWNYKKSEYNLIHNFSMLVEDIKDILRLTSSIIENTE